MEVLHSQYLGGVLGVEIEDVQSKMFHALEALSKRGDDGFNALKRDTR